MAGWADAAVERRMLHGPGPGDSDPQRCVLGGRGRRCAGPGGVAGVARDETKGQPVVSCGKGRVARDVWQGTRGHAVQGVGGFGISALEYSKQRSRRRWSLFNVKEQKMLLRFRFS